MVKAKNKNTGPQVQEVNIDGENCVIIKKDLEHGMKSVTITAKHTYANFYNTTDNAKMLDYESIQEYIKENFSTLTSKCYKFDIQILTRDKWHFNEARLWTPEIHQHEFFNNRHFNISGEDGEILDITEVYAVQIVLIP